MALSGDLSIVYLSMLAAMNCSCYVPLCLNLSPRWTACVVFLCFSDSIVMQARTLGFRYEHAQMPLVSGVEGGGGRFCCVAPNADELWAPVMSHSVMSHEEGRT